MCDLQKNASGELPRSYRPEVQVIGQRGEWLPNGLRFATEEEALANAFDLAGRWMAVTHHRAAPSDDPVNSKWVDGKLVMLETVS
jgi:hypothetical protein